MVNRRSSSNNNANVANETTNSEVAYEENSTISSTNTSSNRSSKSNSLKESTSIKEPLEQQTERLSNENGLDSIIICSTTTATTAKCEETTTTAESSSTAIHAEEDAGEQPSTEERKLICSLPLEHLSGILGTLAQSKRDANSSNSSSSCNLEPHNNKILCLYCDRTFSIEKLYKKHVERVHKMVEGRRTSIRTNNASVAGSGETDALQATFPGCSFCPAASGSKQMITMVAEDLDALFSHLVEDHKEKYFACKPCTVRYSNEENLAMHMKNVHNVETPKKLLPLTKPLSIVVDFEEEIMARAAALRKDDVDIRLTRSSKVNNDRRNDLSAKEQMLIRLGKVAQLVFIKNQVKLIFSFF